MTDEKIKHLEFIQNVITRMNTNSFQIKEWTVAITSALLAVYAATNNNYFILVSVFPIIIFWFLDSYYLTQERKFRALYNDVAGISENPKQLKPFEMRPDLYTEGKCRYRCVLISTTIIKLYLALIIVVVGLFVYLQFFASKGD
ncbi:MAG: hypothetical protein ABIE74_04795 [Pseudomonadota bacterium]